MSSTYLTKTFAQAGNRRTFTISYWIKMGQVSTGADQAIMGAAQDGSNSDDLYIHTGRLNFSGYYGSTAYQVRTTAKYRDLFGWYHHVIRFDSTQSTASDRLRLYVNGELQTALDNNTYPSQNLETTYFNTARLHTIGSIAHSAPNLPFNGSMSHFHFCDGYSYGADSFGQTDSTTGEWKIKTSPSVSYGTNGFFILKDGNSVTDQSGNSNNFTVGGGTLTKTEDCPSNVFATLNPLLQKNDITLSNGNNSCSWGSATTRNVMLSNLGMSSGKYYCEVKVSASSLSPANGNLGIINGSDNSNMGKYLNQDNSVYQGAGYQMWDGSKNINQTGSSYGATLAVGDILGMAIDMDNKALYFHKNGTYQDSGDPTSGSSKTGAVDFSSLTDNGFWFILIGDGSSSGTLTLQTNFGNGYFGTTAVSSAGTNASGNGIFEYDVPNGFTALSTKGLNL